MLSKTKRKVAGVSRRLRKTMKGADLIYPDERELNPYSLMCAECGNYKQFYYTKIVSGRVVFNSVGDMIYEVLDNGIGGLSKKERLSVVLDRHIMTGNFSFDKIDRLKIDFKCAKCSSSDIVLYGDVLDECYQNRCVGCFRCGGAFNKENIEDYCIQCVSLRKLFSGEDDSIFWLTLDMDLFCDACPISEVREGYGIDGETIKRNVCGKL